MSTPNPGTSNAATQIAATGTTCTQTLVTSTVYSNPSHRYCSYSYPSDGWCSWTGEPAHAFIICPYAYEEMDTKGRMFTTGGQSRDILRVEGRGRRRGSQSIPVPKWVVWCVKRFQLLSSMSTLLPSCLDAGVVGPVAGNKRLGKSSSWITF